MGDRRWLALIAAAAVCTALYLGFEVGGYAASDVSGKILVAAAVPALVVIASLAVVAIRLASEIGRPSGVVVEPLVGVARSHQVGASVGIQVAFLFVVFPLLEVLSRAVGLHGTTNVPLEHRSYGIVLLVSWSAILIAPWMEEVSIRGFLLAGLDLRFGFWPAAVASSLVWAALHGVGGVLIPFVAKLALSCAGSAAAPARCEPVSPARSPEHRGHHRHRGGGVCRPACDPARGQLDRDSRGLTRSAGYHRAPGCGARGNGSTGGCLAPARDPGAALGVWIVAGVSLGIGVSLVAVYAAFDAGGSGFETVGRVITAVVAMPLIAWLLVTATRGWGRLRPPACSAAWAR